MSLEIFAFVLGPISNNTYIIRDSQTGEAAIIDPALGSQKVLAAVQKHGWNLSQIWITHAHIDHFTGINQIYAAYTPALPVGLHALDLPLYHNVDLNGARAFGFNLETPPEPTIFFEQGQILSLGDSRLEVRFTPGHTPGHVVFYSPSDGVVFCGDVLFRGSVGRTDLFGGSHTQLMASIRARILSLPAQTRLLSGHGEETTVGDEIRDNPFL
ncbi:Zn-dependent hydrolase, including glyoxylase [Longilinea arvoryzae]|uniref:Zn-dependent hydrolase, including glyoxylase n=1 Tax=Longilinea arvoryzae TaxID=360412 RepID=A0A0S7BI02_9CHLR|nr:MBL fold metallo-hydrolase [Longilinea arvoryzae]GAP15225.1 Zn-dependent hydrolase, including glyoxylase [Longilinea arvoryzae]